MILVRFRWRSVSEGVFPDLIRWPTQRSLTFRFELPRQDRWTHATLWLLRSLGRLGKLDQNCPPVVLECCIRLRGEVHAHAVPIVDTHDAKTPMPQHSWKNAHSSSNC